MANYNQSIIGFWVNIAFDAFINQRNNYSLISEEKYSEMMKEYQLELRRIIPYVLQQKREIHGNFYNFIHYSFFEYFVALSIFSKIGISFHNPNNISDLLDSFKLDLSLPIRHHLVDLISLDQSLQQEEFISFLNLLYKSINEDNKIGKIKKNLIIYIISKQDMRAALSCLKNILNTETNIFIKNSLYWACIRKNDGELLNLYIFLLATEPEYRFYNRGYHLYYYGDIMFDKFPFTDNDENTPWDKTRKFMMDKRINDHKNIPSFIRLLDIWTYIDLAVFHKTLLRSEEIASLKNSYNDLLCYLNEDAKYFFENLFNQINNYPGN